MDGLLYQICMLQYKYMSTLSSTHVFRINTCKKFQTTVNQQSINIMLLNLKCVLYPMLSTVVTEAGKKVGRLVDLLYQNVCYKY